MDVCVLIQWSMGEVTEVLYLALHPTMDFSHLSRKERSRRCVWSVASKQHPNDYRILPSPD